VRVNGSITKNPESPVRIGRDRLEVDGERVASVEFIYLAMNKARGCLGSGRWAVWIRQAKACCC
jgi:16S rRNA U516 pseudouridylate synthase RsuA-like enzyme